MTHKNDFLRKGPAGLVVVPLLFALVTLALLVVMFKVFAAPKPAWWKPSPRTCLMRQPRP